MFSKRRNAKGVAWKPSRRRCGSGEYLRWPCVYLRQSGSRVDWSAPFGAPTFCCWQAPCGARGVDARPGAGRRRLRGEAGHRRPVPVGVVAPHGRRRGRAQASCSCWSCGTARTETATPGVCAFPARASWQSCFLLASLLATDRPWRARASGSAGHARARRRHWIPRGCPCRCLAVEMAYDAMRKAQLSHAIANRLVVLCWCARGREPRGAEREHPSARLASAPCQLYRQKVCCCRSLFSARRGGGHRVRSGLTVPWQHDG